MNRVSATALCLTLFVTGWAIGRGFGMRGRDGEDGTSADSISGSGSAAVTALPGGGEGSGARRVLDRHAEQVIEILEQYELLGSFRFGEWFERKVAEMSFGDMEQLSREICAMERRDLLELGDARELLYQKMLDIDPRRTALAMLREAEWEREAMGGDDMDVDLEYYAAKALGVMARSDPKAAVELVAGVENKLVVELLIENAKHFVTFENFERLSEIASRAGISRYIGSALETLNKKDPARTALLVEAIDDPEARDEAREVIKPKPPRQPIEKEVMRQRLKADPVAVVAELRATPNGSAKLAKLQKMCSTLGQEVGVQAAAMMAELPPTDAYRYVVTNFGRGWGIEDPAAAVRWSAELERPYFQSNGYVTWFAQDREAATVWIENLSTGGVKKRATDKAIELLARTDPADARTLAARLAPDRLEEFERKIRQHE